jgi:hypothetical protein
MGKQPDGLDAKIVNSGIGKSLEVKKTAHNKFPV